MSTTRRHGLYHSIDQIRYKDPFSWSVLGPHLTALAAQTLLGILLNQGLELWSRSGGPGRGELANQDILTMDQVTRSPTAGRMRCALYCSGCAGERSVRGGVRGGADRSLPAQPEGAPGRVLRPDRSQWGRKEHGVPAGERGAAAGWGPRHPGCAPPRSLSSGGRAGPAADLPGAALPVRAADGPDPGRRRPAGARCRHQPRPCAVRQCEGRPGSLQHDRRDSTVSALRSCRAVTDGSCAQRSRCSADPRYTSHSA